MGKVQGLFRAIRAIGEWLWRWEVVGSGAVAILAAGAINALYGGEPNLAGWLFTAAILLVVLKTLTWDEVKTHPERAWVSVVIVVAGVVCFAGSMLWIHLHFKVSTATASQPASAPSSPNPVAQPPEGMSVSGVHMNVGPGVPAGVKVTGVHIKGEYPGLHVSDVHSNRGTGVDIEPSSPTPAPPVATNSAPGGIIITGGAVGTATVVNQHGPPPQILGISEETMPAIPQFSAPADAPDRRYLAMQYNSSLGFERGHPYYPTWNPGLRASFRVSSAFEDPMFDWQCDHPCIETSVSVVSVSNDGQQAVIGAEEGLPPILTPRATVVLTFRSKDPSNPVKNVSVTPHVEGGAAVTPQ